MDILIPPHSTNGLKGIYVQDGVDVVRLIQLQLYSVIYDSETTV